MKERCVAIVLAAGQGKRMKTAVKKQFLHIGGKPVVYYALQCFQQSPLIDKIVLVTSRDCIEYCQRELVEAFGLDKVCAVVEGGRERYDSVYAGLLACEDADYVFIHDGARPFVDEKILQRTFLSAKNYGSGVAGMPSKDTVKIADEENTVLQTPDRNRVWSVQTPQVFAYRLIRRAHEQIRQSDMSQITDDAMALERLGETPVKMVEGSYENIKITTPEDLEVAEVFLRRGFSRKC